MPFLKKKKKRGEERVKGHHPIWFRCRFGRGRGTTKKGKGEKRKGGGERRRNHYRRSVRLDLKETQERKMGGGRGGKKKKKKKKGKKKGGREYATLSGLPKRRPSRETKRVLDFLLKGGGHVEEEKRGREGGGKEVIRSIPSIALTIIEVLDDCVRGEKKSLVNSIRGS